MRKTFILVSALLCVALLPSPSEARSAFFVQLGSSDSESGAREKWDNLKGKYESTLRDLEYSPRTVVPVGGGASTFRIQAGPATDKAHARHICSNLLASGVDCFVVETAVFEGELSIPRTTVSTTVTAPEPTEVAEAEPEPEEEVKEESSFFSRSSVPEEPAEEAVEEASAASTAAAAETVEEATSDGENFFSRFIPSWLEDDDEKEEDVALADEREAAEMEKEMAMAEEPEPEPEPMAEPESEPESEPVEAEMMAEKAEPVVEEPVVDEKELELAAAEIVEVPASEPLETEPFKLAEAEPSASSLQPMDIPEAPPAPPAPEESVVLPWLVDKQIAEETKPLLEADIDPKDVPEGKVDVAEAIPVPISDDAFEAEPVEAVAAPVAQEAEFVKVTTQTGPALSMPGASQAQWLQVSSFASEGAAYDFLKAMQGEVDTAGNLRTRVSRPFSAQNQGGVTLSLGPVQRASTMRAICGFAERYNENLSCGNARPSANSLSRFSLKSAYPGGGRYLTSRREPRYMNSDRTYGKSQSAHLNRESSDFFVQLGSWPNHGQAKRRWDALLEKHKDLLENSSPTYSSPQRTSMGANNKVRLRVGPYKVRDEADKLCGELIRAQVSCLVVSE